MKRRARSVRPQAKAPSPPARAELPQIVDIRDAVAEAKFLVAAAWLTCGSPILDRATAAALSAITGVARGRLDEILVQLDALIALMSEHDG